MAQVYTMLIVALNVFIRYITCNAGFVTSSDLKGCVACAVGAFYHQEKVFRLYSVFPRLSCKPCSEGKTTQGHGARSSKDCNVDYSETTKPTPKTTPGTSTHLEATIPVVLVVAVVVIVGIVLYCRFCKKNFLGKPTPGERTDSFGQLNPAFQALPLERRKTIQPDEESSANQEPVYSVIRDDENQNNDFNNRHYQLINNVNRQSEASTYARFNYSVVQ